jgi:hypothetical protein
VYQIINKDMPKLYTYEVEQKKQETFGNGRYPKRVRIPPLNHLRGEKAYYKFDENCNPYLAEIICERKSTISEYIKDAIKKQEEKKRKKHLVKGIKENISEKSSEYNSDLLDSENISESGEDDARILKIPKGGKKSLAKNYDTILIIKILEANGKNMIRVDKKEYKNLENDNQVKVDKNQEFEILNFSDNLLVVQLVFDENNQN